MKDKTQALHLTKMMQSYIYTTEYELALPLVTVRRSELKSLSVNDVLLLDLQVLKFILIVDENICADLVLNKVGEFYVAEIIKVYKNPTETYNSDKYEKIKLSLGTYHIENIEVGNHLDIAQVYLEKITLMLNSKVLAKGSLVTIEHKIAMQIDKVIK